MTAVLKAHNQRAAFAERAHRANYLEYWEADYRTDRPRTGVEPCIWKWDELKDLMLESAQVIGIDEAERRGLILANPGLGGKPYLTTTMFADVQILSPGEQAPAHRHTTSASRFFMEGEGAYTTVEGERCVGSPGDLVINPSWAWHDHGNIGTGDVTYLNILDVPLVTALGCTFYDHDYYKMGDKSETIQSITKPDERSKKLYAAGGLMPKQRSNTGRAIGARSHAAVRAGSVRWLSGRIRESGKRRSGDAHHVVYDANVCGRTADPAASPHIEHGVLRGGRRRFHPDR
jgi:gentisate 1,2-dioxygenase